MATVGALSMALGSLNFGLFVKPMGDELGIGRAIFGWAQSTRQVASAVTAPVVGVFYRAPEPGAPPFVEVGSHVDEGTTIGLVEVMKMFNSVTAPVHGEVVELLVDNEDFVEFGQPLIVLQPKAVG